MLSRGSKSEAQPPEIHSQAEPGKGKKLPPEILSGNHKKRSAKNMNANKLFNLATSTLLTYRRYIQAGLTLFAGLGLSDRLFSCVQLGIQIHASRTARPAGQNSYRHSERC